MTDNQANSHCCLAGVMANWELLLQISDELLNFVLFAGTQGVTIFT
jgi:hypothetical protein